MTRPQIIRADTIDLQDQNAPSAKDHSRQPTHPAPLGIGPPAPHQADALRQAEEEASEQQHLRAPQLSDKVVANGVVTNLQVGDHPNAAGPNGESQQKVDATGQSDGQTAVEGDEAEGSDLDGDDGVDDDMMDKISSSPSIDDEDIDFKFVYALHTFFATVEGQANATKGDTMVLLDDSNSYWWLVRVVKDSSIGYLPAEHIETPTERLARLNKHRNIDLSATMLGDNPEKSKNPLKKAMRRRNAKTVQFTSVPIYVEASDVEYSSDEEDGDAEAYGDDGDSPETEAHSQAQTQDGAQESEPAEVEPLKSGKPTKDSGVDGTQRSESPVESGDPNSQNGLPRTSDEFFERSEDGMNGKSRKGTLRNTDSFFKDDSVETRKIILTPNLLRDDSSGSTSRSAESKELKIRSSFETLEKTVSPTDKLRDEKRKKERKPGMLSGLFKRKDKKSKAQDDDVEEPEKTSEEISRHSPQPKVSSESLNQDSQQSPKAPQQAQRQPSKLQKAPPGNVALGKAEQSDTRSSPTKSNGPVQAPPERPAPMAAMPSSTRVLSPDGGRRIDDTPAPLRVRSPETFRVGTPTDHADSKSGGGGGVFAPITNALKSSSPTTSSEPKPEKVKRAKRRTAMDDFDDPSPDAEEARSGVMGGGEREVESEAQQSRRAHPPTNQVQPQPQPQPQYQPSQMQTQTQPQSQPHPAPSTARGPPPSESPIHASPLATPIITPSTFTSDGHETKPDPSPSASASSSPSIPIDTPSTATTTRSHPPPPAPAPAPSPAWSDAALRAYLDDDTHGEMRDLLIVVHDKTGVVPAGPDHPLVGRMFRDETRQLDDLGRRLDGLLAAWLERKKVAAVTTPTGTANATRVGGAG